MVQNKWKIFAIFRHVEISLRLTPTQASFSKKKKKKVKHQLCSMSFLTWNEVNFRCKWHFICYFSLFFSLFSKFMFIFTNIGDIILMTGIMSMNNFEQFFSSSTHNVVLNKQLFGNLLNWTVAGKFKFIWVNYFANHLTERMLTMM